MPSLTYSTDILDVLHGVLRMLCRSLPQYLIEAKPWLQNDDAAFLAALRNLIVDQRHYAQLVAEAIVARLRPVPAAAVKRRLAELKDAATEVSYLSFDRAVPLFDKAIAAEPAGSLRQTNFDLAPIWFGKEMARLRRSIANRECACPMANASYANMLLHPPIRHEAAVAGENFRLR